MLEHPHVRLISYSKPAAQVKQGLKDCQDLIAFCARVSNPDNQMNTESSNKLLDYLIKHSHWSPFEMASACLEITTTRDIARQILRHRSFSFQEFSQRYADPTKDLEFVVREARMQDKKNRQNSFETDDEKIKEQWEEKQKMIIEMSKTVYAWARENNIAKEQARAVLPEGNTISRLYINGTLRSWLHYVELRTDVSTQKEHREIAKMCGIHIMKILPMISEFSHIHQVVAGEK